MQKKKREKLEYYANKQPPKAIKIEISSKYNSNSNNPSTIKQSETVITKNVCPKQRNEKKKKKKEKN